MPLPAFAAVLLAIACAAGAGCTEAAQSSPSGPAQGATAAQVGDRTITLADLDKEALGADTGNYGGMKLYQAVYEARRRALDAMIARHLIEREAKARGIPVDKLVDAEVTGHIRPTSDADIEAWYRERRVQTPLEQVKTAIRNVMEQERRDEAREAFVDRLRAKAGVRVMLEPPRLDVRVASGDPARGPAAAPVQIVEFSDFQ